MGKKIFWKIFLIILFLFPMFSWGDFVLNWSNTSTDFTVKTPGISSDEVESQEDIDPESNFLENVMSIVSRYAWVFLVVVAFGVLLRGGFLLMSSQWEEEEMKKWNRIVTYALIWFIVALLAYLIVKLAINLF